MFEKINIFYKLGLWTADMVYNAVNKGVITEIEYNEILGVEDTENIVETPKELI